MGILYSFRDTRISALEQEVYELMRLVLQLVLSLVHYKAKASITLDDFSIGREL